MIKKLTSFLGVALFILVCYVTFMLTWPYYKAWQYESDARDIIRFELRGPRGPEMMKDKLYVAGSNMGVPVLENAILVSQDYEGRYQAKISWTENVDIFGYYQKTYEFRFEVGGKELGTKR